jgi:hypothetical protein
MSARRTTFYVSKSNRGWIVKTESSQGHLGPYSDREQAVIMALAFAKDHRPSEVRVRNSFDGWWVEGQFDDPSPAS